MNAFLDTTVLVAAFYGDHERHGPSFELFVRQSASHAGTAAHCLAETYSVLTGMPGKHRASPAEALLFLGSVRERLSTIALDGPEYAAALENAAANGISGGGIYDAIIGWCALKAKVQRVYTWNLKHFTRLCPAVASLAALPPG